MRTKIGCKLGLCYSVYHTNIHLHEVISFDTLMLFWDSAWEDMEDGYMDQEDLNNTHHILYDLCPEFAYEHEQDRVPTPGSTWVSESGRLYSFEPASLIETNPLTGQTTVNYINSYRWEYVKTINA